jgi:hypothetical protein
MFGQGRMSHSHAGLNFRRVGDRLEPFGLDDVFQGKADLVKRWFGNIHLEASDPDNPASHYVALGHDAFLWGETAPTLPTEPNVVGFGELEEKVDCAALPWPPTSSKSAQAGPLVITTSYARQATQSEEDPDRLVLMVPKFAAQGPAESALAASINEELDRFVSAWTTRLERQELRWLDIHCDTLKSVRDQLSVLCLVMREGGAIPFGKEAFAINLRLANGGSKPIAASEVLGAGDAVLRRATRSCFDTKPPQLTKNDVAAFGLLADGVDLALRVRNGARDEIERCPVPFEALELRADFPATSAR